MSLNGIEVSGLKSDYRIKMKDDDPKQAGSNNFVTNLINNIGNFLNGSMSVDNGSTSSGAFNA